MPDLIVQIRGVLTLAEIVTIRDTLKPCWNSIPQAIRDRLSLNVEITNREANL